MLWRSNEEKNPASDGGNTQLNKDSDRQDTVKKALDEVKDLKETLDQLKAKRDNIGNLTVESAQESGAKPPMQAAPETDEAVEAAQQAILDQARRDAEEKRLAHEKQKQREEQIIQDKKATEEAQKRVEEKKKEIQRLRQAQIEAERKAAAVRRKQKLADLAAGAEPVKEELPMRVIAQRESEIMQKRRQELEKKRIDDHEKLLQQQRKILQQQKRPLQEEQRKAEEKQRRFAEQERKKERQRLIEQERALQRQRRARAEEEIRQLKAEQEAQKRAERAARAERLKKAREERARRNELRNRNKLAEKSAELGGGIVNVHGVQVSTEIEPVPAFSWRDLLGIVSKREKKAVESEEELRALLEETERKKEEARLVAARLSQLRRIKRQNSELGKRYLRFRNFCDKKKKPLLIGFAALLTIVVGTAGVFNFFTVFEYSYNGKVLGYVNNRDNVIQITDLVQETLTEEKNINVVIDSKKDIKFKRVADFNRELPVDTPDDVLRRLTYMGDLNVKAYGIYIDGKKVGTVKDKEAAANVLQAIKDRYSSDKSGTKIEEAVIVEDIQIRRINSDFEDISPEEQMVETLCTSGQKETLHKVVVGETLADIARDYGTTEKELLKDNEGIDPRKLEVGSSLVIRMKAPVMTVKITEVRTYDKKIKFKTEKKKDKDMYEGYSEVDQEGQDGLSTLTDRTVSINGEVKETENLETAIKKEPVPKIIRVGTKDRPPTVGSGKYIWPAKDGTYTVTSEFKWRWGRQHQGIDLGCPQGTTVMAADGGTVTYAGYMGGYGLLVIIDHQNGMETYYGHNSSLTVSTGDKVFQGQQIAYSGNTGNSTGPHIHFGIMVNGTFENPRNYLP